MNILIVANFTRDFSETDNGRFFYITKMLSKTHKVEIITTEFDHGTKEKKKPIVNEYPFKITLLKEPGYKKNVSLRRFYSHYIWGKNLKKYLKTIEKPDVVYCAVPSLTGPNMAAKYCRKMGIRFIIDIQDLWPEAFRIAVNIPFVSSLLFYPFGRIADSIYRNADSVCGVSNTYVKRALRVNNKCTNGITVFLGTELKTFDEYARGEPFIKKPDNSVWIAYIGTLGSSYDLICVFDAMEILANKGQHPKFVVMGDGPRRKEFEQYASQKAIDVLFTGALPYNQMCATLCICDIAVNPIVGSSVATIINKHGDYASSGIPVVNTQQDEEYCSLVEQYQMGYNCRNSDSADVADKIGLLMADETLRKNMGRNARRCAEEKFDRGYSYKALVDEITKQ